MMNAAPAIPRLGVPAYDWWNEALHGVARAGIATVFPQAIGLAATWDDRSPCARSRRHRRRGPRQVQRGPARSGKHGRYQGLTFWSPNINIFRDPRWGRGQETYGEDPYLTGRMGVAFVHGLQGDDPPLPQALATAKHFAVHSGPEPRAPPLRRHASRARPARHLPAPVRGLRARGPRRRGDGRLQPRLRRAVRRQSRSCSTDAARRSGASTATWSPTAARSTTSTAHHRITTSTPEEAAAAASARRHRSQLRRQLRALVRAVQQRAHHRESRSTAHVRRALRPRASGWASSTRPTRSPGTRDPPSRSTTRPRTASWPRSPRQSLVLLEEPRRRVAARPRRLRRIAVVGPTADNVAVLLGNYHGTPPSR